MLPTVKGFRFAAVSAGIRKDGRVDVALCEASSNTTVAGVFTRNIVRAAPVVIASQRVQKEGVRAVLVNAGCANACTGEPGFAAVRESTAAVAEALGVDAESVLPASTGVIGALLPADKIRLKASQLVAQLSAEGAEDFSKAILTTDRWPKVESTRLESPNGGATLLAIGKGAGMIHPDVGPPHATMLVFLFTDARVASPLLARVLQRASDDTFNVCSVDGDTSTNDTVLALASGRANVEVEEHELYRGFFEVCDRLARSMVADGEGAEHAAEIVVSGLPTEKDARQIARTVASSLLVKTALYGRDANWGRLLAAAGRAGVPFDPALASVAVGAVEIVRNGMSRGAEAEARAAEVLEQPSYRIELSLGSGPGRARYLTSDLGHGYVDVNADYRS
jgi:glutamate N-acetyltransferase/amino-acid N-acetyltransferase